MLKSICKLVAVLPIAVLTLAAADPILGTWKLNTAKSKYSPGPGPKSSTVTFSEEGDWLVTRTEGVDAEGQQVSRSNRYKRDGKEYPYDGPSGKGTIAVKRSDDYHSDGTIKGTGGSTSKVRTVISKDGKTRTLRVTGVDAKGQKVNHTIVYDKQ
jgi:hypothetical protein